MPPRRSTSKSATPSKSRSRSRSQSQGRASASARASTQAAQRSSVSPRHSAHVERASTSLSPAQTSLRHEMSQVEAILANRRGKNGAPPPTRVGPATTQRNGWGYWGAVLTMELLVLVWCCWAYDLFSRAVSKP